MPFWPVDSFEVKMIKAQTDSRTGFYLSLNWLKKMKQEFCSMKRGVFVLLLLFHKTSLCMANMCLLNIGSSHLPMNCLPPHGSPRPEPPLQFRMVHKPQCLTVQEPLMPFWLTHIYVIKFVFLLLICFKSI